MEVKAIAQTAARQLDYVEQKAEQADIIEAFLKRRMFLLCFQPGMAKAYASALRVSLISMLSCESAAAIV